MYTVNINGKDYSWAEDVKLLNFLRDVLFLNGTKNACAQGVCGACTVIVDGKASRSCLLPLSKLADKKIITIEGLTKKEQEIYGTAFSVAGAVQCGFCTPGIVMATKALLDANIDATDEEIKKQLRTNICRCTGYVKIIEAVHLAQKYIKEGKVPKISKDDTKFGGSFIRLDAYDKAIGKARYADDYNEQDFKNLAHASAVRLNVARAKINSIDISQALKHKDCIKILLRKDVPNPVIGKLVKDWDVLIGEGMETRTVGDSVALVVSKKKESLDEIKSLVKVDFTVLPPVCSPSDALKKDAPLVHESGNVLYSATIARGGDVEKAIKESAFSVSGEFSTPATEHAFMEPECAVAEPQFDKKGDKSPSGIKLYASDQNIYDAAHECSYMLNIPMDKVHVISSTVGGAFGGKEDMSVQHHATLAAWCTGLPVKVLFSRKESINYHPKKHPMEIKMTLACDKEGNFTALKADILADTGAYASLGRAVVQRACTHASGPYRIPVNHVEGKAVYTNNVPFGAFRGFGVTQSLFALESLINRLAKKVGLDDWQIRRKNALNPGDTMPNGQIAGVDTGIVECLEKSKDFYYSSPRAGIACSLKNAGLGVGVPDTGRCRLIIKGGKVHIATAAACVGQGVHSIAFQYVKETTGLKSSDIVVENPDTYVTPDSGTATASRHTVVTGEATKRASILLKNALKKSSLKELEGQEFLGEYTTETDPIGSPKDNPVSHVAYSYAVHTAILDEDNRLKKMYAVLDAGTVINKLNLEGQLEGGAVMGIGFALTEDFPLKDGVPTKGYGQLGLLRITDIPEIEVHTVSTKNTHDYSYGAKGAGEIVAISPTPAIAGAYYKVTGIEENKLPLENTPYHK